MPAFEEVCKNVDEDFRQRKRKTRNQRNYRERKKQRMKFMEQEIERLAKAYQLLKRENERLRQRLKLNEGST